MKETVKVDKVSLKRSIKEKKKLMGKIVLKDKCEDCDCSDNKKCEL